MTAPPTIRLTKQLAAMLDAARVYGAAVDARDRLDATIPQGERNGCGVDPANKWYAPLREMRAVVATAERNAARTARAWGRAQQPKRGAP